MIGAETEPEIATCKKQKRMWIRTGNNYLNVPGETADTI